MPDLFGNHIVGFPTRRHIYFEKPGRHNSSATEPGALFHTGRVQGPVVQNFVSLTLSLSPQFVNYISTLKANTLSFFVETM